MRSIRHSSFNVFVTIWIDKHVLSRLQNSQYFCVFKYARAVKQKVWNEAENRERDWGETLKIRACEARELRARKTLTPRFADFFTDFEKKTDCFAVFSLSPHTPNGPVRLARCARKTLTPRFADFFTDFEKKNDCFAVYVLSAPFRRIECVKVVSGTNVDFLMRRTQKYKIWMIICDNLYENVILPSL